MKSPLVVLSIAILGACAGSVAPSPPPPACVDSVDVIPSGAPYSCSPGASASVSLLPPEDAPPLSPHVLVVCQCGAP